MELTHLQYLEEILSSKYACDHLTGYQQETIDALAELLSYCPYERLCELAQADREGRVKILPKSEKRTCGDCKHFNRTPGKRSGTCSVREWYADRYGNIDIRRGRFTPNQSRLACMQYIARDGAAEAALEGMKNA